MTNSLILFFYKYSKYFEEPLTNEVLNDIIYYLEKKWYLQILKQFGIITILIILEFYQKEEDYMICKELLNTIESSNKYFGTNYPLNLEEYGNMSKL